MIAVPQIQFLRFPCATMNFVVTVVLAAAVSASAVVTNLANATIVEFSYYLRYFTISFR
jgi:hypothetical protein